MNSISNNLKNKQTWWLVKAAGLYAVCCTYFHDMFWVIMDHFNLSYFNSNLGRSLCSKCNERSNIVIICHFISGK